MCLSWHSLGPALDFRYGLLAGYAEDLRISAVLLCPLGVRALAVRARGVQIQPCEHEAENVCMASRQSFRLWAQAVDDHQNAHGPQPRLHCNNGIELLLLASLGVRAPASTPRLPKLSLTPLCGGLASPLLKSLHAWPALNCVTPYRQT